MTLFRPTLPLRRATLLLAAAIAPLMAPMAAAAQGFETLPRPAPSPAPIIAPEPVIKATPAPKPAPAIKPAPVIKPAPAPKPAATPKPTPTPPQKAAPPKLAPTATPSAAPIASTPAPDPIVVPEEPASTAPPAASLASANDLVQPLALAGGLIVALMLLALVIRLIRRIIARRRAQATPARAPRKAKPKAKRSPPKPRPLPVPAEAEVEPQVPAPTLPPLPEPEALTQPEPPPLPEPPPKPKAQPEPAPEIPAVPAKGFQPSPLFAAIAEEPETPPLPADCLRLTLEPTRLTLSLSQAVLRYRLILTNHAPEPLGPISITTAIGATGLSPSAQGPEDSHRLILIQPGAQASLAGEAHLPLAAVAPVRVGGAELFGLILRADVEAARIGPLASLPPLRIEAAFAVGEAHENGDPGQSALRLDRKPWSSEHLTARNLGEEP